MNKSILGIALLLTSQIHTASAEAPEPTAPTVASHALSRENHTSHGMLPSQPIPIPQSHPYRTQHLSYDAYIPEMARSYPERPAPPYADRNIRCVSMPSNESDKFSPLQLGLQDPLITLAYRKYHAFLQQQQVVASAVLSRIQAAEKKIHDASSEELEDGGNIRRRLLSFKSKKKVAEEKILIQQKENAKRIQEASVDMRDVMADLQVFSESTALSALEKRVKEARENGNYATTLAQLRDAAC